MNKLWLALALAGAVLVGGCASLDPVNKEQKKRENASHAQKETNAAVRRLEKAIKD